MSEEVQGKVSKEKVCSLKDIKEQTPEICLRAVRDSGLALEFVENQTLEICLEAINQNLNALRYVRESVEGISKLSDKQLNSLNSILSNIKNVFLSLEIFGVCRLYEEDGTTYLTCGEISFIVGDTVKSRGVGLNETSLKKMGLLITKTVEMLVSTIYFPIKEICFNIDFNDFTRGILVSSTKEEGSYNFFLL